MPKKWRALIFGIQDVGNERERESVFRELQSGVVACVSWGRLNIHANKGGSGLGLVGARGPLPVLPLLLLILQSSTVIIGT